VELLQVRAQRGRLGSISRWTAATPTSTTPSTSTNAKEAIARGAAVQAAAVLTEAGVRELRQAWAPDTEVLIEPGTRGRSEPGQLPKVSQSSANGPVGLDGGVGETNIDRVLAAGPTYVVIGWRLFAATPSTMEPLG
jgi:hypothetical protein